MGRTAIRLCFTNLYKTKGQTLHLNKIEQTSLLVCQQIFLILADLAL